MQSFVKTLAVTLCMMVIACGGVAAEEIKPIVVLFENVRIFDGRSADPIGIESLPTSR